MEPQSADLNPLERLSDQVQPCEVHQEGAAYKSSADMLSCQYGPECFQHLAESGSWRIKATLEAREGPTRQQQGVPNKVVFINVLLALRHRYIYILNIYSNLKQAHQKRLLSVCLGRCTTSGFWNSRISLKHPLALPTHLTSSLTCMSSCLLFKGHLLPHRHN